MHGDTIVGAPFEEEHPLRSMLFDDRHAALPTDEQSDADISRRLFQIRMADSAGRRTAASILINRMYATRGYVSSGLPEQAEPSRITLVASEDDATIGTITIGFESSDGLLMVDDLFAREANELRRGGRTLSEFTKLAMDGVVKSRRVLAALFHVAYIYSHRIMGASNLLIEVNPRHTSYYRRMLGFEVIASARLNRRVNAPAVLLCLNFDHAHAQIERFGGHPENARTERSLYPYFFSPEDEAGIVGRLRGLGGRERREGRAPLPLQPQYVKARSPHLSLAQAT